MPLSTHIMRASKAERRIQEILKDAAQHGSGRYFCGRATAEVRN